MRLGVLDVGSNTVHLLVVDAHAGGPPVPATSHKVDLHLAEQLGAGGEITEAGIERLVATVAAATSAAAEAGAENVLPFATSALREATNAESVLDLVERRTGIRLQVLGGEDEAGLTFLAARRWYGWSAGRLLVVDIGGGSLEVAVGEDEAPEYARSLPLGAGRLTRESFAAGGHRAPDPDEVTALRLRVRREVARLAPQLNGSRRAGRAVATSKTFRTLARLCSADADHGGAIGLRREDLRGWVPRLAGMDLAARAALPGVTANRAPQLLAGAIVAEGLMDLLDLTELDICPWALREGVLLHYYDSLPGVRPEPRIVAVPPVRS
jgi:exopolyphosphatase/guanosine-5'-triphosphate,3'-diphosphate pyrophosphatase